jgi:hypothetical protein
MMATELPRNRGWLPTAMPVDAQHSRQRTNPAQALRRSLVGSPSGGTIISAPAEPHLLRFDKAAPASRPGARTCRATACEGSPARGIVRGDARASRPAPKDCRRHRRPGARGHAAAPRGASRGHHRRRRGNSRGRGRGTGDASTTATRASWVWRAPWPTRPSKQRWPRWRSAFSRARGCHCSRVREIQQLPPLLHRRGILGDASRLACHRLRDARRPRACARRSQCRQRSGGHKRRAPSG